MKNILKAVLPVLAFASLALAGTEAHRQFTENALKTSVTVDKPNGRAVVGQGAGMQIFPIKESTNASGIMVTATQTSGANQGRVAALSYTFASQIVTISGGGKTNLGSDQ